MRQNAAGDRHRVVAVVGNGVSAFELSIAREVFGLDPRLGVPWYEFELASADPSPVTTDGGAMMVAVPRGLAPLRHADTVVVPLSGRGRVHPPELLLALRRAHARGARMVSLCTGAFTLAAAGLLDGRAAATHWSHADELARLHPRVSVDPRVLYVDEGDILTSAGSAAGIDLCLHVVRKDFGAAIANEVARDLVVPPHRDGGQAQFVVQPVPEPSVGTDLFAATMEWAQAHLDEDLPVQLLARRCAMSMRTFARRFGEATGTTPHQWVLRQRIVLAQRLLETTDLPIDLVAARCGLGTATNLRQQFQRVVGAAPSAYRRTFRAAG